METLIYDDFADKPEPGFWSGLYDNILDLMIDQPLLVVAVIEILTD